eukprot:GAFH01003710.1.p1 GENE.GAFH01003710.1~~GAFH01003710.1.p1  ORF type:complete len:203 (+),score=32.45 GAFH01003710.1:175-783(+)
MAKQGQMECAKIMAKDLVRTRHYIQRFYKMRTELQAISLRVQTLKSTQQMAESMKGVTRIMGRMNRAMNLPQLQRIMMEFERANEQLDMKGEMMSDAVDDALEEDGAEAESDAVVQQVFEEIGIDLHQQMTAVPTDALPATAAAQAAKPQAVSVGESAGASRPPPPPAGGAGLPPPPPPPAAPSSGGDLDAELQARLDNLRR